MARVSFSALTTSRQRRPIPSSPKHRRTKICGSLLLSRFALGLCTGVSWICRLDEDGQESKAATTKILRTERQSLVTLFMSKTHTSGKLVKSTPKSKNSSALEVGRPGSGAGRPVPLRGKSVPSRSVLPTAHAAPYPAIPIRQDASLALTTQVIAISKGKFCALLESRKGSARGRLAHDPANPA